MGKSQQAMATIAGRGHFKLQRHVADGELLLPGEQQMVWDLCVLCNCLTCGALLGQHLEELQ